MKFLLYWRGSGDVELVEGSTIAEAFSNAGYGAGALRALDYYEPFTPYKSTLEPGFTGNIPDYFWYSGLVLAMLHSHDDTIWLRELQEQQPGGPEHRFPPMTMTEYFKWVHGRIWSETPLAWGCAEE
jgi:hypothetical protein